MGLDIVIYDECRLLTRTALGRLKQTGKWHTNPYCLTIKEDGKLQKRCAGLKNAFVQKVLAADQVAKSTCYCGVTEYVMPVVIQGKLICMVAAVGFRGQLSEHMEKLLSARTGLSSRKFRKLRENGLKIVDDEQGIIKAVEILGTLVKAYLAEDASLSRLLGGSGKEQNAYVLQAMDYIGQNFAKPIGPGAVAEYCHVNTSYLQHLFSSALGHGVAQQIRLCRLSYGEELLCTTGYTVEQISYLCGFSSADYFSTAFKKQFGCAPLQYRKRYK